MPGALDQTTVCFTDEMLHLTFASLNVYIVEYIWGALKFILLNGQSIKD